MSNLSIALSVSWELFSKHKMIMLNVLVERSAAVDAAVNHRTLQDSFIFYTS